jgi:hypothetical protein
MRQRETERRRGTEGGRTGDRGGERSQILKSQVKEVILQYHRNK